MNFGATSNRLLDSPLAFFPLITLSGGSQKKMLSKKFHAARSLEKVELDIMEKSRQCYPMVKRAFPVSLQYWGDDPLEVNGIFATDDGDFFFIDFEPQNGLVVQALAVERGLQMVRLMSLMGVVGNKTALSDLHYGDS